MLKLKKNLKSIIALSMALIFGLVSPLRAFANETPEVSVNVSTNDDTLVEEIIKDVPVFTPVDYNVTTTKEDINTNETFLRQMKTVFENAGTFFIERIFFKNTVDKDYKKNLKIEGDNITIRYVDPETKKWINTSNLDNLKHTTLYIDTDIKSYVVSVPAVYKNEFISNTLTIAEDKEQNVKITKEDGYYNLEMSFYQNEKYIGEYWFIESDKKLVDFSKIETFERLLPHDLATNRRWSYDGYYFKTPENYIPTTTNKDELVLYKHPSNYTGSSLVKYDDSNFGKIMGYVTTMICMENQNEFGYWQTGPKSLWLFEDFGIESEFYDTRFNTDFANNLISAYKTYNKKEFLKSAVKYAQFFIKYAQDNSYITQNGGILVEDYGYEKIHSKTHVSLNHQLAEMNFLYDLYSVTKEDNYLQVAEKMLLGIEDTRNKWILPDSNLAYALYYTKDTNKMQDYPYLTYNDLYDTKMILKRVLNKSNEAIEYLMASKMIYMDNNDIKGYKSN